MKDGVQRRMLQGDWNALVRWRAQRCAAWGFRRHARGRLVARQVQGDALAEWIWIAGTLPNAIALAISSAGAAIRRQSGIDALALLSILVALIFGEFLVAAVVSLMLATGRALEDYAQSRAGGR